MNKQTDFDQNYKDKLVISSVDDLSVKILNKQLFYRVIESIDSLPDCLLVEL